VDERIATALFLEVVCGQNDNIRTNLLIIILEDVGCSADVDFQETLLKLLTRSRVNQPAS
jgi:hypothetical protein